MDETGYPPQGPQWYGDGDQAAPPPPPYPEEAPYPQCQQQDEGDPGDPTTQPIVVAAPAMRFGEAPVPMKCPFCHADVVTATRHTWGLATWLLVGACCIFGLLFGCCLIILWNGLKDVTHTCPNCQRMVGKYPRIGKYQRVGEYRIS